MTAKDLRAIEDAMTMRDLVPVALGILNRMRSSGRSVAQVCGPISSGGFSRKDLNLSVFQYAIEVVEARGKLVFNQLIFQEAIPRILVRYTKVLDPVHAKRIILTDFYKYIFMSGLIEEAYFIPNFYTSDGARWEEGICQQEGIPRYIIDGF